MDAPAGRSNNSAGPPPGLFDTRSMRAAISSFGSTVSAILARSPRFSSSAMNALTSVNMGQSLRTGIGDSRRQRERAHAGLTGHDRRPSGLHGIDEIRELAAKRLVLRHLEMSAFDRRPLAGARRHAPDLRR